MKFRNKFLNVLYTLAPSGIGFSLGFVATKLFIEGLWVHGIICIFAFVYAFVMIAGAMYGERK